MQAADLAFLLGRLIQAAAFLPVSLVFMAALLAAVMAVLGIGVRGKHGVRAVFDRVEEDPRALATFLGSVVLASGIIVAALVR